MTDTPQTIDLQAMGAQAKTATQTLALLSSAAKANALRAVADSIDANAGGILAANHHDLEDGRAAGLSDALLDRLDLQHRLDGIVDDVCSVAELPDPVGESFDVRTLANGLRVHRRRTPLGVLGVIYEARPNVTVEVASLALKTGNAVILRGGKETLRSNQALVQVIRDALAAVDFPPDAVQLIQSTDRAYVAELLRLDAYVDMLIPRGGAGLHRLCREQSSIPVITGGIGICHLYVDASADLDAALDVIHNAKTQRPSVCNALDTVLVHNSVAAGFLPRVVSHLGASGVSFRAEPSAMAHLSGQAGVQPAGPEDFDTEWLSLVLGLKVVPGLDDAVTHVQQHSTGHSDGILTADADHAAHFLNAVDSAVVYVNASTRFTDGSALELGAEVAVSTQKLHARGPMALEALTTYKWIVEGDYHVRK